MGRKLGRNDRCWCGSGKKFKKCHLGRELADPPSIQTIIETANAEYARRCCLHPDRLNCVGDGIKAHSIQRTGGLSRIAVDGKVYGIRDVNLGDLAKSKGLVSPKLVGVREASTFSGMCRFHDNQTFAPIETQPFVSCNEHAFLLAYRSFCKAVFTKRAVLNLFPVLREVDQGQPVECQRDFQRFLDEYRNSSEHGANDAETIKAKYDHRLLNKDFSDVRYYAIRFDRVPDILTCSCNFPTFDFAGNHLQNLAEVEGVPDHVAFSIITTNAGGAVIFSWIRECPSSVRLVESLHNISDDEIGDAVVRYAFEFCENTYLSPNWWDKLCDERKTALRLRICDAATLMLPRSNRCLCSDGHEYVDWGVASRETNLNL